MGVTKATLGAPEIAGAFERGGVVGLGDSRVQNLRRLAASGSTLPRALIRSPMPSEVDAVVRAAGTSLNTETTVLDALGASAKRHGTVHGVILMTELGDLREGVLPADVVDLALHAERLPHLRLVGIGANLACQSGIAPDQSKMDELSVLAERVEEALGRRLEVISGGNSANLGWALGAPQVGRVNELRLGESILLGVDPLLRLPIDGLHVDACVLAAEVIEVQVKPSRPWGTVGHSAFGVAPLREGTGSRRQALVALGHQDVAPAGVTPPPGYTVLGASSDHLVLDVGDERVSVGDCLRFAVDYSALVRAMTSPFVAKDLRRTSRAVPSTPPA